jgi:PAS domain S-box-containing protein
MGGADKTARTAASSDDIAALRESEERYRRTFELAASGMAHIAPDRRFIRVNRRLCEMLGYTAEELTRLKGRDISHPDDLDIVNALRPKLYSGEIPSVRVEKRYLRKDGSVVWAAFTMVLERDAAGKPLYEIAVFDDITAQREAEEALRIERERFRAVVDSANEGILVYDKDLRVVDSNAAAERIIGLTREEMIGKPGFTSLLPCVNADGTPMGPADRPTRRTLDTGQPLAGMLIGIRRNEVETTWLSVNTGFLRNPDGSSSGIVSTVSDITAQRTQEAALKDSEERFRHTVEYAEDGIANVSLDGRFLLVNRRLCEMLGRAEEELVGLSVKDISHSDDRDITDQQRNLLRTGEKRSVHFEKRYLRRDGTPFWVSLTIGLVRDQRGEPLYEIAVFNDITERKDAEEALKEAHEELKRSNAELEQFAYVASHDLQEPLRMVSSYTQLLQRRYKEKFDGDANEFMGYIVDGAARMKQLIEDLLAYSRVGTRGKDFRPVEVEGALRRAVANLRAAISESGASVSNDPLPVVEADDVQLAQLFQNLIGNALKFRSSSVPRIHVSVTSTDLEYQFAVADNGIGIEPQYFERIFMVFQRLHNKGEYPGTGIGLAICKKVVERHGGRIWVDSKLGEGTTFHFTLPRRRDGNGQEQRPG